MGAEQGFHVIVTFRSDEQSEEQARSLHAEGHSAEGYRLDLGDPAGFHGTKCSSTPSTLVAPPAEAATWIAWAATLPEGGPNGGVFLEGQRIG